MKKANSLAHEPAPGRHTRDKILRAASRIVVVFLALVWMQTASSPSRWLFGNPDANVLFASAIDNSNRLGPANTPTATALSTLRPPTSSSPRSVGSSPTLATEGGVATRFAPQPATQKERVPSLTLVAASPVPPLPNPSATFLPKATVTANLPVYPTNATKPPTVQPISVQYTPVVVNGTPVTPIRSYPPTALAPRFTPTRLSSTAVATPLTLVPGQTLVVPTAQLPTWPARTATPLPPIPTPVILTYP